MSNIKVTNIEKVDGGFIVNITDPIPEIKILHIKIAIEEYLNRPVWAIKDSCLELTYKDGAIVVITRDDLEKIFKTIFPQ